MGAQIIHKFTALNKECNKRSFAGTFQLPASGKINMENSKTAQQVYMGICVWREIGHFFSLREDAFEFLSLRIGWVIYDSPNVYKDTALNDYLQSMYLSKNDCIGYFLAAIETTNLNKKNPFYVGYAVSNNKTRLYDVNNMQIFKF